MSYSVTYMNHKGAGCMRTFPNEERLEKFVRTLRTAATIYKDGKPIGAVWFAPGEADDQRIRWNWCFESSDPNMTDGPRGEANWRQRQ